MNVHFKFRTGIYVLVSLVGLMLITMVCYLTGVNHFFESFLDFSYFDLLMGQIANTLIVLSLTSVLSADFGQVYWVDIKDSKLVTPFWGCFIGITVYLLTALIFSGAAYVTGFYAGIVVSATLATIWLIILTFKMISIYFGKEELKKPLVVEYKRMLILSNTSYVSDYLRRLEKYLTEIEGKTFSGKNRYIKKLKKEIQNIKQGLFSGNEQLVDAAHKEHIDKFVKCQDELREIDIKIEEYTKNAMNNNVTEVVRENIELLVECENYHTFFNLIEELFDWDEKYTCKMLRDLSKKNMDWVIKDKMNFFKQYALQKLIVQSGKLDAIQNLLLIYDVTNLGMKNLESRIKVITGKAHELKAKEIQMDRELDASEDFRACMRSQREAKKLMKQEEEQLKNELVSILEGASAKDLRSFYVPIREANIAYDEGKYEIVNRYVTVILANYQQDVQCIQVFSGLLDMSARGEVTFSYVTEEELSMIRQLIEKDKINQTIPKYAKEILAQMNQVTI